MLLVAPHIQIPLGEIRFEFVRSSGPGGQNVNKLNTKAVLRWGVARSPAVPADVRHRFLTRFQRRITAAGDLVLTSQRFRQRQRNVADCLQKLRAMLASVAAAPVPRKPTRPTRGAIQRRLHTKQVRSRKKRERRASRSATED